MSVCVCLHGEGLIGILFFPYINSVVFILDRVSNAVGFTGYGKIFKSRIQYLSGVKNVLLAKGAVKNV